MNPFNLLEFADTWRMKKLSGVLFIIVALASLTSIGRPWVSRQLQSYLVAKEQPCLDYAKTMGDQMILQQWHDRLQRDDALRAARPRVNPNLPQAVYLAPHAPLGNGR